MFLVNFPLTQTIEANSSLQFSHVFMEVWCWILEISHGFCHRSHHLLLIHRMNTTWLTYSPHLGHRPEPQWFSGCSKSLDDWQNQLEIHGFWLCLFGSLGSSGWSRCFFCVSNPFLATHISQRWILSASFSYDVTLFSWRISTKKSRVLFNIQWNSGDWTLEGTRREPEGKTRRIAEISPRLSPHHFVSCDGGHVFLKQRLHSSSIKKMQKRINTDEHLIGRNTCRFDPQPMKPMFNIGKYRKQS